MSLTSPTKSTAGPPPYVSGALPLPLPPPAPESPRGLRDQIRRHWPWCVSLTIIVIVAILGVILWRTWGNTATPGPSPGMDLQPSRGWHADIRKLLATEAEVLFPSVATQPDGPGVERLLYTFLTAPNGNVRVELTQGTAFYHQQKFSNLTIEATNDAFVCSVEKPGAMPEFYVHQGTLSSPADCFDGTSSIRTLTDGLIPGVMKRPLLRMTLALGKDGYDGPSHPGLLPLYNIALKVRLQEGSEAGLPADEIDEANEKVMSKLNGKAGKFRALSRKCDVKPYTHTKCHSYCFGRCGPECTCWAWVCGDCDCHRGCENHDYWCTCYGPWHPLCFTFQSVTAGTCGCCRGPDHTPGLLG